MEESRFENIPLDRTAPSPLNPRTSYEGPEFNDLVASIAQKGVIQPVLVRPVNCDTADYQLVAGHRRYYALLAVAKTNGGPEAHTLPAVVRDLSDDDAFDLMLIENLQRQDLSELEEARSFQAFVERHGRPAIKDLAERTGINLNYIRRRLAVLSLPKRTLNAWEKGELKYGHCEQLLRVDPKEVQHLTKKIKDMKGALTVKEVERTINEDSPEMAWAMWDLETAGCNECRHNSAAQAALAGRRETEPRCSNQRCFKQNQSNWLNAHWAETETARKHKTNGFRFWGDIDWPDMNHLFHKYPKCKTCEHLVSVITLAGEEHRERTCVGATDCIKEQDGKRIQLERRKEKAKTLADVLADPDPDEPRVDWHGSHFRDKFWLQQIPVKAYDLPVNDLQSLRLCLAMMINGTRDNANMGTRFASRHGHARAITELEKDDRWSYFCVGDTWVIKKVFELDKAEVLAEMRQVALDLVYPALAEPGRGALARRLGVDLASEFTMTREYLEKKTIPELHRIGEDTGVFADIKAQAYLEEILNFKGGQTFRHCKKGELVEVFLSSGIDLKGLVPAEILRGADDGEEDEG